MCLVAPANHTTEVHPGNLPSKPKWAAVSYKNLAVTPVGLCTLKSKQRLSQTLYAVMNSTVEASIPKSSHNMNKIRIFKTLCAVASLLSYTTGTDHTCKSWITPIWAAGEVNNVCTSTPKNSDGGKRRHSMPGVLPPCSWQSDMILAMMRSS